MTPETILDAEAVAQHLRCSPEQAEALMRNRELPGTKVGRGWITTYGEVVQFVIQRIRSESKRPAAVGARIDSTQTKSRRKQLVQLPDLTR
jgi:hypothetical protein